jgi:hypothetical protein
VAGLEREKPDQASTPMPIDQQISRDAKEPGTNIDSVTTKPGPSLPGSTERFGMQVFRFRKVGGSNAQVSQD